MKITLENGALVLNIAFNPIYGLLPDFCIIKNYKYLFDN